MMASAVKTRPNHYERLGLSPDASADDVARAFAREISSFRPHAISDIAHITTAYETLRDPAKRRAYDASIAPEPDPEPEPEPEPDPKPDFEPAARHDAWPFIASARIGSAELPALHTLPRPAPPEPAAAPERPRSLETESRQQPSPRLRDDRSLEALFEDRFRLFDDGTRDWKRPATIAGGLFLGVALLGAGLGWYASRDIEPAQAKPAIALPIPKAIPPAAATPSYRAPKMAEAGSQRHVRSTAAAPRTRQAPHRAEPVASDQQRAEDVPDIPTEQVAALTAQDSAASAKMPLPDAVIARTIGRIGYACGDVESTTAIEGTPGAFKVTCTSGDSYRAAPVRGRYHFKRW